jgi:hypothetical protein
MIRSLIAASAVVFLASCATDPLGRQTFVTTESATVLHNGATEPFEVQLRAGYGAPEFWCAAGRFASSQNMSLGSRIYRLTPTPRPQGSGMVFTFIPPAGGGQPTGLATIGGAGDSLSGSTARDQCRIVRLRKQNFR